MAEPTTPEVRNLRFDMNDETPRYWHNGHPAITTFFNNLSVFFPAGERFFISAVKAHRANVKDDPQLDREVRAFCGQEGMHTREHLRYNQMLRDQGYPVDAMENRVERLLARVSRHANKRRQLAITCALEHFTALMAHTLLSDPRVLEGADPVMADLWRWHAAEENEHKAVAYDVYCRSGGNYFERALVMIGATVIFWLKVFEHQIRMMRADGTARSPRQWGQLLWFLFGRPGALRRLLRPYFSYYRPGFHPWDHDNRELLEAWKQQLEAAPAYGRTTPPAQAA